MAAGVAGVLAAAAALGHAGTSSLAAYALTAAVFNPVLMAVQGALRGSMPFIAEAGGGELGPVVRDAAWLALSAGALGGLLVTAAPELAAAAGAAEAAAGAFGALPLLMGCALLAASLQSCATTLLVALGRSREAMRTGLVGTGLSVALVLALVPGAGPLPVLGTAGAGAGMLLGSAAAAATGHLLLRRAVAEEGGGSGPGRPDWRAVLRIARVGLPLGTTMLIKFGVLGLLVMAAAGAGAAEAAAHQITASLAGFAFLPATAAGQAAVPFMARAAAARGPRAARRPLLAGAAVALPAVALTAAATAAAAGPLLGALTPDPRVQGLVLSLLPLLLLLVLADAAQALPGMGLIAVKRTSPTLYSFALCYGALAAAAFPLAAAGGLAWLWTAFTAATAGLVAGQAAGFLRATGLR
ncbi:matE family protein [Nocardiopsis sp. CNT-189]